MRIFITCLLAVLAMVTGTVVGGILGDQGPGFDAAPFIVGVVCAALVVWARIGLHRDRHTS